MITGLTTPITGSTLNIVFLGKAPGTDVYTFTAYANAPCTTTTTLKVPIEVTPTPPVTVATTPDVGTKAHPVSTATGELFGYDETADLTINGPLPLTFRRYYASYLSANNVSSPLGTNWMSNYDVSLAISAANATVTLFRGKDGDVQTVERSVAAFERRAAPLSADRGRLRLSIPRSPLQSHLRIQSGRRAHQHSGPQRQHPYCHPRTQRPHSGCRRPGPHSCLHLHRREFNEATGSSRPHSQLTNTRAARFPHGRMPMAIVRRSATPQSPAMCRPRSSTA